MTNDEAEKLVERADQAGIMAASRTINLLATASTDAMIAAIRSVSGDSGAGLDEQRKDLLAVRTKLSSAFASTESALAVLVVTQMGVAVVSGFMAEVDAQNEALPEKTVIKPDKKEALLLAELPILGNTRQETAAHIAGSWRFAVEGDVGKAAAIGDASTLPPAILDTNRKTANQVANAVAESWVAGQGAARRAIGIALTRMVQNA
jgi:hypothetical protein